MKNKRIYNPFLSLKKFRFGSILIRNFLIIIVLEILLICLLTGLYTFQLEESTTKEVLDIHYMELQRSAETLDTVIEQAENFAYYFSVENDVKVLFINGDVEEESAAFRAISSRLKSFRRTFDYVESTHLYIEKEGIVIGESVVAELSEVADSGWLDFYDEIRENSYILRSRCTDGGYPFLLTMLLAVRNVQKETIGAVVIDINVKKLNEAIGRSSKDDQKVYMVDKEGRLLYSSMPSAIKYPEQIPTDLMELSQNEVNAVITNETGTEIVVTVVPSKTENWRYLMYSAISGYNEKMSGIRWQMFRNACMAALVGLVLSWFMAIRSYRPIQNIMEEVEGSEEIKDDFIEGENVINEVQYITGMIRSAERRNKKLTMEISEWMEKLGNAQFMALQSQINPHFLYNTLDAISWLAIDRLGNKNPVSEALGALANLLRLSMKRTSYLVPLREELEHAKMYMYLMNIRYPGKINVSWEIPRELYNVSVIRLCLQPILENAIRHGLRDNCYRGTICIRGEIVNEMLILRVEDDGSGMPMEECKNMNAKLYTDYQTVDKHVGIVNVNQRIKIVFGEDYGVLLQPGEEKGLVVMICVPGTID